MLKEKLIDLKEYVEDAWFLRFLLKIQLCHPSSLCNFLFVYFLLIPSYLILIFVIGLPLLTWYPKAAEVGDSYEHFSEGRVRELIKEFTRNGSRQVYSRQNIHSVNWLSSKAKEILEEKQYWVRSNVGYQYFSLESTIGVPESEQLANVVVEISSETVRNNNSLLFMAHFDSTFNTPGASDNGCGVSVLFEMMRILINRKEWVSYPVIFYFVNSEENGQYGSSSIKNFGRFEDIKRFVNVDNLGGKGKFQMIKVEPSVLAKEVSSISQIQGDQITITMMNHFPHSTDFESLERLDIPGFEFSQTQMSFEYHTDLDNDETGITEGSIQLLGNALERFYDVYVYDGKESPLEKNPLAESDNDYVFYNIFGFDYSWYSRMTSLVLSILFFFLIAFILVSVFLGLDYYQILIKPGSPYYETQPMFEKNGEEETGFWKHLYKKLVVLSVYCFGYILSFLFGGGVSSVVGLLISTKNVMAFQRNFTLTAITLSIASLFGMLIPQYFVHLFLHYCFQMHHYVDVQDRYVSLYILLSVLIVAFEAFELPIPSIWLYIFNYPAALAFCLVNFLLQKILLGVIDPKKIKMKLKRKSDLKKSKEKFDDSEKEKVYDVYDGEKSTNMEQFLEDMPPSIVMDTDYDRGLSELVPTVGLDDGSEDFGSTQVDYEDGEEELKNHLEHKEGVEDEKSMTTSDEEGEEESDQTTTTGVVTDDLEESRSRDDEDTSGSVEEGGAEISGFTETEEESYSHEEDTSNYQKEDEESDYHDDLGQDEKKKEKLDGSRILELGYDSAYILLIRERCCFSIIPYLLLVIGLFHMTNCWMLMSQTFPIFGKGDYVLPAVIFSFVVSFFTISVFTCILAWFQRAANFLRVLLVLGVILLVLTIVTLSQFPYSTSQPKRVTVTLETEISQTIDVSLLYNNQETGSTDVDQSDEATGFIYSWDSDEIDADHQVFDYYLDNSAYSKSNILCSDSGVCEFPIENNDIRRIKKYNLKKLSSSSFELEMNFDSTAYFVVSVASQNAILSSFSDSRVISKDSSSEYFYVNVISEKLKFKVEIDNGGNKVDLRMMIRYCDDDSKPDFISQMFEMQDWMTLVGSKCKESHNGNDVAHLREECKSCDFLKTSYEFNVVL